MGGQGCQSGLARRDPQADEILRQRPASEESDGESGDTPVTPRPERVNMEEPRVGKGQKAETTRDDREAAGESGMKVKSDNTQT